MNLLYKLQESLSKPWAIHEPIAKSLIPVIKGIAKGDKGSFAQLRESYHRPKASFYKMKSMEYGDLMDDEQDFQEDVLVRYPINGVLTKEGAMCSKGMAAMCQDIKSLGENKNVRGVALVIDSPGGSVDGTEELSSVVRDFSSNYNKPIAVVMDGLTASAGFWVASGADRIFVKDNTTMAGSIGVLMQFEDYSKFEEELGVESYVVRATKSFNKSVDVEEYINGNKSKLISRLDQINDVFIGTVQKNREDINTSIVQDGIPLVFTGEVFMGKDIVKMGLADQMGGVEDAMKWLERENKKRSSNNPTPQTKDIQTPIGANHNSKNDFQMKNLFSKIALMFGLSSVVTEKGETMSIEDFKAQLPEMDMREDFIKEIVSKEMKEAQTSQPKFDELKALINAQNEAIESMKATQQELTGEIAALKGQPKVVAKDNDGEIPKDIDYSSAEATDAGQFAKQLFQAGAMTKEQYNAELAKIAKQQG